MIPFCGIQVPSVVFKHLDDLLRFICLHIYSALIHPAKVIKVIPPSKQLSRKVFDLILFNNLCQQKTKSGPATMCASPDLIWWDKENCRYATGVSVQFSPGEVLKEIIKYREKKSMNIWNFQVFFLSLPSICNR
jgi:hypothetical protein